MKIKKPRSAGRQQGSKKRPRQTIWFIAEYLLSFPGGAERSIYEEIRILSKTYDVKVLTFDSFYPKKTVQVSAHVTAINYHLPCRLLMSRFINNMLNERFVKRQIYEYAKEIKDAKYVMTQTLISPIVAEACVDLGVPYHYYLRDEVMLNEFHNYEVGLRRYLKAIKSCIEWPARRKYVRENTRAIQQASRLVVNSRFMGNLMRQKFGRASVVVYPKIDVSILDKRRMLQKREYVLFVGEGVAMKGNDIAHRIAASMPDVKFLFIGPFSKKKAERNITYALWSKDLMRIYGRVKLAIVPSRWNEAFCRLVVELGYLHIPCITSDRGGLPEANPRKELIIPDVENIDAWVCTIRKLLKVGEKQPASISFKRR